ncbi:MAG TPA: STAS domain-containing protein [Tepidisphaeraceae bacterium]|jgi:anti-anti-sigma factor
MATNAPNLVTSAQQTGDELHATIVGEIDLHNSPSLRNHLLELDSKGQPKKVVLDLSGVPYMDSSAIAVLVELLQKIRKRSGQVVLSKPQPRVKGLLEIARLNTIFIIE